MSWPNIVARDVRTTTGNNIQHIQEMTGLDHWGCLESQVRKVMGENVAVLPMQDEWRLLVFHFLIISINYATSIVYFKYLLMINNA